MRLESNIPCDENDIARFGGLGLENLPGGIMTVFNLSVVVTGSQYRLGG